MDARINGKPFGLVLHANAGSYLQINHAEASNVGTRNLTHVGAYGISAPGKVSDLGRDDGLIDRVAIGAWKAENVPVAVFEVPAGGSQVSTVATVDIHTAFVRRAGVGIGPATGRYGVPSGATGTIYRTAAPVVLQIGTWTSKPAVVSIEDSYAYSKAPRPADEGAARGGSLGADFMLANGSVIDFGNAILYLKD